MGVPECFGILLFGFVNTGKIEVGYIPVLFEFVGTIDEFNGLIGITKIVEENTKLKIKCGIGWVNRGGLKPVRNCHVGRAFGVGNECSVNREKIFPDGDVYRIQFGRSFSGIKGALGKVGTSLFFFIGGFFFGKIGVGYGEIDLREFLGIVGVVDIQLSCSLEF